MKTTFHYFEIMAFTIPKALLLLSSLFFSAKFSLSASTYSSLNYSTSSFINNQCKSTPYPEACLDSLKLSISINLNPNILSFLLQILQTALSESGKLLNQLSNTIIQESQKGTIQDCKELHQITITSLKKSVSLLDISQANSKQLANARAYLSAAVTNKATCLEGLNSASGANKQGLVNSIDATYKHVSNALSIVSKKVPNGRKNRRLMGFPTWLSRKDRHIIHYQVDEYDTSQMVTVSGDGTGNFTSIMDAINFAPNGSDERIIVYVKEGVYEENVMIPIWKTNVFLVGDGSDSTVIIGNRSVGDGWTTYRSATFAVTGDGFLARDITIWNTAGPEKHQAVALRINADFAAFYKCAITGYQDTLYAHSFRQFYRECDISGTVDYIFGNAAAVFQRCNIISRMPMPKQFIAITAQSRTSTDEFTGFSLQNCSILATEDLYSNSSRIKSYLGRPWQNYSTTVYMGCYIDDFIAPQGWSKWSAGDDNGLATLYYGEYNNYGPGAVTDNRVNWEGYHVMDDEDAEGFTVSELIDGGDWLDATSFPYDDGV